MKVSYANRHKHTVFYTHSYMTYWYSYNLLQLSIPIIVRCCHQLTAALTKCPAKTQK